MTPIFDTETDGYLERLGQTLSTGGWSDVLRRSRRRERRTRLLRTAVVVGGAAAAAAGVVGGLSVVGELGGPSIVEKAQAVVLEGLDPAEGTVEHLLVEYHSDPVILSQNGPGPDVTTWDTVRLRDSQRPFIVYETWIAADGSWCRRTVEGAPNDSVAPTRLTECRTSEGLIELYLPSRNEILRARPSPPAERELEPAAVPGTSGWVVRPKPDGTVVIERDGHAATPDELDALPDDDLVAIKRAASNVGASAAAELPDPGPAPDWLTEDIVAAFRRDAVRDAGTLVFEGHEYTLLLTEDAGRVPGSNAVLVDPSTGEGVAWIPDPRAFGVPTIVVRTSETLPDDADSRRQLSLTELHPDAVVRDVSPAELAAAREEQYPNG
jgi:hypothetical protein